MPLNDSSSTKGKVKSFVLVSYLFFDWSSSTISFVACSSKVTTLFSQSSTGSFFIDIIGDVFPLDSFDFASLTLASPTFSLSAFGRKMSASILLRILSCQVFEPSDGIIRGSSFFFFLAEIKKLFSNIYIPLLVIFIG